MLLIFPADHQEQWFRLWFGGPVTEAEAKNLTRLVKWMEN